MKKAGFRKRMKNTNKCSMRRASNSRPVSITASWPALANQKIENRFHAFDLMVGISEEHFDLENYGIEDFKNENALTYLWLLYDLIKEDGFSANLYLNEVLSYLDCFRDKKYCYFLAKLLFKNQAVNKKLLKEFVISLIIGSIQRTPKSGRQDSRFRA